MMWYFERLYVVAGLTGALSHQSLQMYTGLTGALPEQVPPPPHPNVDNTYPIIS